MPDKSKKFKTLSLALILAGVFLVAATLALEAYRYPWQTVFGGPQDDSALPDPSSIVWQNGDGEAASSAGASPPASALPEASSSQAILPGNETPGGTQPVRYTELGIIKIPKLNLSQYILEGTQGQMHYGVGHVTGTAQPGGDGNCALAGHNTTSFRYLGKLAAGDRVILKSGKNVYVYSVFRSFTVLPAQTEVLRAVPNETAVLTMITCTPYLTATHRLIVQARLTEVNGSAPSSAASAGYEADPDVPSSRSEPKSESTDSPASG